LVRVAINAKSSNNVVATNALFKVKFFFPYDFYDGASKQGIQPPEICGAVVPINFARGDFKCLVEVTLGQDVSAAELIVEHSLYLLLPYLCAHFVFFSVEMLKASHNHIVNCGNCTVVTVDAHSLVTTAITAVFKGLVCLFDGTCAVLVVDADLFELSHSIPPFPLRVLFQCF
jgi:hypothetical protein